MTISPYLGGIIVRCFPNSTDTYTLTVTNNPGTILPVTGGIGTKSLTLAGTVLVLGAALGLGWKRRQEG